ncbi:MAG TPA: 2-amino-4-hydroxy-6-hydroxymethyldihydropteridine diphosphokinase [Dehalococcoidia bacterium]|nr:2-amino-4-hydroxy-6-hydroxymethyldihydropteridine diphosphokinase [Dehalococcoidia bacterium]
MSAAAGAPRTVQLALGSNLGDRLLNLRGALGRLATRGSLIAVSGLFETAPSGVTEQPAFYNAACALATPLSLPELLVLAKQIEWELGRRPSRVWGPRPCDIDILLAGEETCASPSLTVPHPRLAERGFVLAPLAEIAAKVVVPGTGKTVQALCSALPVAEREGVRRIAGPEWAVG